MLVISERSTQQSVAEGTRLYPRETMRGSVASLAGAVDTLIPYTSDINYDFRFSSTVTFCMLCLLDY